MMQVQEMYETCVDAIKNFMKVTDAQEVVIGLSGGLDSSVVCTMAVDALGATHVHGVLLPGPYSTENSIGDAEELAAALNVETSTVSICEPFEAFEKVLARPCGGELSGIAAENTQARCRMVCIMALSNAHGWIVLNTGNKSEAQMGYSTLYGDTAGAFAPIGGLYKTDVYAVARWRNEQAAAHDENTPIPENVITKDPSAELSPNQKDEASLGITYDVLDRILIAAFEHNMSVDEIAETYGFDRTRVASVIERAQSYEFKRAVEPPTPTADFYA